MSISKIHIIKGIPYIDTILKTIEVVRFTLDLYELLFGVNTNKENKNIGYDKIEYY